MHEALLENIVWHALSGPQAAFASGNHEARRYARGFSPIVGFADAARPSFASLSPYCAPGEHFYCAGWSGAAPSGWRIEADSSAHQFVWNAPPPPGDESFDPVRLGPEHVPQMMALVEMTHPGPFGPRTVELGEYFGVFEDGRLIAMAGERMAAGRLREISGVCTHPERQGRGLARRLMHRLIRREMDRGLVPFLHVMHENVNARGLYARMGFRDHREVALRVVSREW